LTTTPPAPRPDAEPRQTAYLKQIVITLVCGVLLAWGSCYGFIHRSGLSIDFASALLGLGFFVGVALVLTSGVRILIAIVKLLIRALSGEQ
jgi:hypothetical protein